ncbi:MAG: Na+/H+ antiporter NhaA [Myxococcota bacterium]|nr:Na+/H+ antiporter NhaA [Myxococcota bacterium]
MSEHAIEKSAFRRQFEKLQELSAFLLVGTVAALIWANTDHHSYEEAFHKINFLGHYNLLHFLVNDIFMVLFFGIAMKEVSESFLPGGALSSVNKAAMPVVATLGGVFGPIGLFFLLRGVLAPDPDIFNAWAVPTATDIAYAWLFAGLIFGRAHPAVLFLLVLAVLDDLIGMMIIAVFYTSQVHAEWLGLVVLGVVLCELLRRKGVKSFWPYFIIGTPLCWIGLYKCGVHPALAMVPVVPFMPHAVRDAGIFAEGEHHHDTMNEFEHFFKPIVDVGLLTFGLANAGVVLSGSSLSGSPTWIIFLSLLVGKTVGVLAFAFLGKGMGLNLPKGMDFKQVIVMGMVAAIGFTVALFVTSVALKAGISPELQALYAESGTADMLKLGALLSFAAGPIAWMTASLLKVKKIHTKEEAAALEAS